MTYNDTINIVLGIIIVIIIIIIMYYIKFVQQKFENEQSSNYWHTKQNKESSTNDRIRDCKK